MAWESGTATSHLNLMAKIRDFLKTNATLTGLGQNWTQLAGPTSGNPTVGQEIVLRGPGLAAGDQVLVGLNSFENIGSDIYNLGIYGLVSYNDAMPLASQVGLLGPVYLSAWNSPTPYWIVANGRRFFVIAKISTVYQHIYGGFILPYNEPESWPYPLFVGGTNVNNFRFSQSNDSRHRAYWDPGWRTAWLLFPDGAWKAVTQWSNSATSETAVNEVNVFPWRGGLASTRDCLGGEYLLEPAEITCTVPFPGVLGVLDGVFKVSGFSTSSEAVITISGQDYLVAQNVYRTGNEDYAAFKLA